MQLAKNALYVLTHDTGEREKQDRLDKAELKFGMRGADVLKLAPPDKILYCPAAAAVKLIFMLHFVVLNTALDLGNDPPGPSILSKVTRTA